MLILWKFVWINILAHGLFYFARPIFVWAICRLDIVHFQWCYYLPLSAMTSKTSNPNIEVKMRLKSTCLGSHGFKKTCLSFGLIPPFAFQISANFHLRWDHRELRLINLFPTVLKDHPKIIHLLFGSYLEFSYMLKPFIKVFRQHKDKVFFTKKYAIFYQKMCNNIFSSHLEGVLSNLSCTPHCKNHQYFQIEKKLSKLVLNCTLVNDQGLQNAWPTT